MDWEDPTQINNAKSFFDNCVTTWNPRRDHGTHMAIHQSVENGPCLLDIEEIFKANPLQDYDKLLNRV